MGQTLEIRMFGPFQVLRDGEAVPDAAWGRRKTRTLFKVLLSERGRAFTTDQLIDRLYPEGAPDKLLKNLRGRVSELRRALEPGLTRGADSRYVRAVEGGYCLSREAPCWVDVEAFAAGLDEAESLARTERWRAALEAYERALALYRGPFLVEDLYEDWSAPLRDRLAAARLDALERAAASHGELGQYRRGLAPLERLLAEAPHREGAIRLRMRFHHYLGEHRRALEAYHAGVGALKDHLGVEPSPATRSLYLQIKQHELPLPRRPAPHNLPAPLAPLVGRGRELKALGNRLRDPGCRLLTLVGPGGAGKTRLAVELGRASLDDFPDGVFWVGLAGVPSAEGIVYEAAQALDFRFFGRDAPRDQLAAYLRAKRVCLILDNFEHLTEGTDVLLAWLQAAPGLTCLVTSRARLGAAGECLFPLEGLAWTGAEDDEAVALFLDRARAAEPRFAPSRADREAIERICRLLEGMPLAIELAAAWVGVLPPGEIAAEIERSLDFLSGERRGGPERHRSVRASFEHSWALLTDAERRALGGISAFRGAFARDAAAAVGVSLAELSSLVGKSFVRHTADGHFETHELLRQFALERLHADPARATAVYAAGAGHYGACVARWAAALKGERQTEALRAFGVQLDNVHAAWRWSLEARPDLCGPFVEGLYLFYEMRGWFHAGARAFAEAAGVLAGSEALAPAGAEARIRLGRFRFHLGQLEAAQRELETALATLDAAEASGALALFGLGLVHENAGRYEEAEALLQRSLAAYEAADDAYGAATARLNLGIVAFDRGDYGAAGRHYEACQRLCENLGDRFVLAKALNNRGNLHYVQEAFEEAIPFYERAVAHFRELGVAWGEHTALNNLGGANNTLGNYDSAKEYYREALTVSRRLGYDTGTAMTLANLSETEHRLGLRDEARAHLREGLALARATDVTWLIMDAVVFLGRQLREEGALEPAAELLSAMARLHQMQYMRDNASSILAEMEDRLPRARLQQIRAEAERRSFADVLARVDALLGAE